jgi:hypothetical protein
VNAKDKGNKFGRKLEFFCFPRAQESVTMTSKTSDFPSGLSLSGDLFSSNSVNSFYDSELNDFSGFNGNFQEDSFFSGSSNTPSYDESLLFDTSSPSQVGSPMDESVCFSPFFFKFHFFSHPF